MADSSSEHENEVPILTIYSNSTEQQVPCEFSIEFDERRKTTTISWGGKNKIEIGNAEKSIKLTDEHNNELVMNRDGISLSSSKNIKLTAQGDVVLSGMNVTADAKANATLSGMNVKANAKSDVTLTGTNIKAEAKMGFTAKASATAELTSSGQTTIKGGIVVIN